MPPGPSQKGTNKKNGTALQKQSRHSTPAAVANTISQEAYDPDYLNTRVIIIQNLSTDDIVEHGAFNATVPDSRSVDSMLERLKSLIGVMEKRSTFYDRGMRFVAQERKNHPDELELGRTDGDGDAKRPKHKRKKVGDSGAAPDGVSNELSSPARPPKRKHSHDQDSASSSLSPIAAASPGAAEAEDKVKKDAEALKKEDSSSSSSEDEGAPPRREVPQMQTFGEDPSTFPDPTVYEILPWHDGMSEEEKKEIFSVAVYPKSDLSDLIVGDPPDKDFSNTKPTSQINFTTFTTYLEPYFRPFAEEDLTFLRERADRVTPFLMPRRGKRHYTEIWAEEDGNMAIDSPVQGRDKLSPNQARGSIENMNDVVGEADTLSIGPLASRLLSILRPEKRAQPSDDKPLTNGINGDNMTNGDVNGEDQVNGNGEDKPNPLPAATYMTDSSTEAWKKATHSKLEYAQVDVRLKQELQHIGLLPQEAAETDYDGHFDDEVAGRLRTLQARLKEQMLINGARKARLTELVHEEMAHQEYQTILEDLDTQVQSAYLKRTRTMGKSKKTKRPGGAGGGSHAIGAAAGMARPGIGDVTKTLMERRRRWMDTIGSVFNDENLGKVPRVEDPDSSIFKSEDMTHLMKKEKEQWDEEVEEE